MKPRFKSMIWNIRKNQHSTTTARRKKNSKNKDSIRNLWDISKCINIQIIGMPEEEEEEQEIENLFENIMKENFFNLAKEVNI